MKMYAVQVISGKENSYLKELNKAIENKGMAENFGRLVYPQQEYTKNAKGKSRTYKKAFWTTGYVYVEFEKSSKVLNLVVNTKNFIKFLSGDSMNPLPMTDEEALKITKGLETDWKGEKAENLATGDVVKITEGPFANFTGEVVKHVSGEKYTVNVEVFGRATPVDIELNSLEKAS